MDHAEYVGPIKKLSGRRALIMADESYDLPLEQRTVKAQFDGREDWRLPSEFKLQHPETGAMLCVGWHTFPASHFKLLVTVCT